MAASKLIDRYRRTFYNRYKAADFMVAHGYERLAAITAVKNAENVYRVPSLVAIEPGGNRYVPMDGDSTPGGRGVWARAIVRQTGESKYEITVYLRTFL